MTNKIQHTEVLLVEDSPSLAAVYQGYLSAENCHVRYAHNGSEALDAIEKCTPDVVLLDLHLPDISGMDVLKTIHHQGWNCSVIIITAHGSVDTAIEAMRYGAVDFVVKPFDKTRLLVTLDNVLEKRQLTNMVEHYKKTFDRDKFHKFIGNSLPMQAVFRIIESAAPSRATVFVTGESGTGKELTAEALHCESERRDNSFIALNCAAIPRDLMESEIFGHVKGAFTGAVARRDGAASRADGGTFFLDEVCEMDIELQSKLLRFIQTGRFQRVGDSKEEQVDVRIVCATNRDPMTEVKEGRFREDLYYRLNVIPLHLPPLRDRGEDSLLIASEILHRMAKEESRDFKGFSPAVTDVFKNYFWPGNVRELENVIRNIVVLNNGEQVSYEMLPASLLEGQQAGIDRYIQANKVIPETGGNLTVDSKGETTDLESEVPIVTHTELGLSDNDSKTATEIRPLWQEEKQIIERAISICDGNIPKAATYLEVSASTIYRKRLAWESN